MGLNRTLHNPRAWVAVEPDEEPAAEADEPVDDVGADPDDELGADEADDELEELESAGSANATHGVCHSGSYAERDRQHANADNVLRLHWQDPLFLLSGSWERRPRQHLLNTSQIGLLYIFWQI